jgi:hypothetical protein
MKPSSKPVKCWCCEETVPCHSVINIVPDGRKRYKLCGSCVGIFAVLESRLNTIAKNGKLPPELTAKGKDVPKCEK